MYNLDRLVLVEVVFIWVELRRSESLTLFPSLTFSLVVAKLI